MLEALPNYQTNPCLSSASPGRASGLDLWIGPQTVAPRHVKAATGVRFDGHGDRDRIPSGDAGGAGEHARDKNFSPSQDRFACLARDHHLLITCNMAQANGLERGKESECRCVSGPVAWLCAKHAKPFPPSTMVNYLSLARER